MEKVDFEKVIGLLSKMLDIKNDLKEHIESAKSSSNDDDDDDNEEQSHDEKICEELSEEYESIMKWCFGKKFHQMTREESMAKWKARHDDLPMPRSLLTTQLNPMFHTLALMLDVIPMYHANKKED